MRVKQTKEVITCDACHKEVEEAREEWIFRSQCYFSYLSSGTVDLVIKCSGDMKEICKECANDIYLGFIKEQPRLLRREDE